MLRTNKARSWAPLLAALMLLVTQPSQAAILRVQDPTLVGLGSAQDGYNVTRDTLNGLDWLDWSLTTGFSTSRGQTFLTGPGGLLDGWRLATALEFAGLGKSAGVPLPYLDQMVVGDPPPELRDLALALGITQASDQSAFATFAEAGTRPGTVRLGGITLAYRASRTSPETSAVFDIPNDPQLWLSQSWPVSLQHSTLGVALVRVADVATVPAPMTSLVMAIGLFGLVAGRRLQRAGSMA